MRFLFTVQPATGHLNPVAGLAQCLQDMGHEVRVATAKGFLSHVEAVGLDGVAAGRDWLESEAATDLPGFLEGGLPVQVDMFAQLGPEFLDDLLTETWRPDVVVRETVEFAGAVYAEEIGVPCVTHGIGLRIPAALLERWARASLETLMTRVARPAGLEFFDRGTILNHLPRSWVPERTPLLEGERFFAPAAPPSSSAPEVPWLQQRDAGRPLVYATFGTVFNAAAPAFEGLIEAAQGAGFDLLITLGGNGRPETFDPPPNVHIERYVDQDAVLRRAAAVVCHGGTGTVMGALSHGLPMCCVPLGADQPVNAKRCTALGCGRSYTTYVPDHGLPLPHARLEDLDSTVMREHIDALLEDGSYRQAAGRLATEMRNLPGITEEAQLLSELAT
jgi:UDP:flavonoid glycosyltransferase YjiC (YdhE family)